MLIKNNLLLIAILIVAVFFRVYQFNQSPPSLNWDEVSLGYNAYSILTTGRDEWGRFMPLTFEAFGDFKLPGYIYTLVPFIATLGLNDFSVRMPSLIAGILSVLLLFLVTLKVTDRKTALIASLLLAISPWHIFYSRIALEANLAFCYFLIGLTSFLYGLDSKKHQTLLLSISALFWGITLFTYNSARVFLPLFILGLGILRFKQIKILRNKFITPSFIFSIFIAVALYFAIFQDSSSRYFWVSIIDQGAINSINEARGASTLPDLITKLLHNRVTYFITHFIENYISHFDPRYLFITGGINSQFSLPNFGLVYLIEFPFLLFGLITMLKSKLGRIVLLWLILAPIPSAITREAPHALRSIFMLGSIQIIAAVGVFWLYNAWKEKWARWALVFIVVSIYATYLSTFISLYYQEYPKKYSQSWQYGYEEVIGYLNANASGYDQVFVSKKYGEPHMFYLFYTQYSPEKYIYNNSLVRYDRSNWRWVDRLDSLTFINDWEIKEKDDFPPNALLITSPDNFPTNFKVLQSIYFLDGSKAFDISTNR